MQHQTSRALHLSKYILAALLLSIGAYVALDMMRTTVSAADEAENETTQASSQSALIERLNSVNIDKSFLNNPYYASLREYTLTITKIDSGRQNPFAPLGGGAPVPAAQQRAR